MSARRALRGSSAAPISLEHARRIAIAAQGLDRARPRRVRAADLLRTIRALGLLQLDFVTVLVPAHHHTLYARLGAHDPELLFELVRERAITEQWAREASLVPVETWPLLHHRREEKKTRRRWVTRFLKRYPSYMDEVLDAIRKNGPLGAEQLHLPAGAKQLERHAWRSSVQGEVIEALFAWGIVAATGRREDRSRTYDLAERVIPAEHRARTTDRLEAIRGLLLQAARAHGIGTASDLADAWRLRVPEVRLVLPDLVEEGALLRVAVEGWKEPAYLHPEARVPRRVNAAALLAPFDPLVANRKRAERLFGFEYRLEVFTPRSKRRYGPWVLPFLLGDRLVARVDVKADRHTSTLHAHGAWLESHASAAEVVEPLARELHGLAKWLGLARVAVGARGDLAVSLRRAVARSGEAS